MTGSTALAHSPSRVRLHVEAVGPAQWDLGSSVMAAAHARTGLPRSVTRRDLAAHVHERQQRAAAVWGSVQDRAVGSALAAGSAAGSATHERIGYELST